MLNCQCDMPLFAYSDWCNDNNFEITESELNQAVSLVSYHYGGGYYMGCGRDYGYYDIERNIVSSGLYYYSNGDASAVLMKIGVGYCDTFGHGFGYDNIY